MMPPPNVTGVLHLGHALENSLMDIEVRFQRMRGKRALLIPGTDHAALPTQARVEDNLKKSGIANPRAHYGRDGLLEIIRDYAEESKATILNQIRQLGTSCDWSRLAYTFDEERSRIVNHVFKRMYDDGLIYRGYRIVNWSIEGQSTASDDELLHVERQTMLYTFKYSKDFPIAIATVLPETKLGDTAVAVHPDDERYQQYIGQVFTVDVGADAPREIRVIADTAVDPNFGTGALGVTPAHSATDFDMYQKHPEIGLIQVVGQDGLMTAAAGEGYVGLPYKEARAKFVQWLRDQDLLVSEVEVTHSAPMSDRFKDEIWSMPMEQWFVSVDTEIPGRGKTLKQLMHDAVTTGLDGDAQKKVQIIPERFENIYLQWIENLHDWCISRQIWWGHRIPVWYRDEEVYCGEVAPTVASTEAMAGKPDGEWRQDEDTLDTWFSSGMWTFSTLGYPDNPDFQTYHPTAWMQMGHEILQLWMARMILFSAYTLEDIPFRDVYIHGILRDKAGKKFSKSLGNGIDPLEVMEQYGTDALRLSLIKGIAPGNDARFYEEKVEDARNFVNKLWNVTRFVLGQEDVPAPTELSLADQWITSKLNHLVQAVTAHLEAYEFSPAAEKIYSFVWRDFADWYVEVTKFQPNPQLTREILKTILTIAHPFIPFITEVLWKEMGHVDLLMVKQWPACPDEPVADDAEKLFTALQAFIIHIRALRAQYNIPPATIIELSHFDATDEEFLIVERLARVQYVHVEEGGIPIEAAGWTGRLHIEKVIDVAAEKIRIAKQITETTKHLQSAEAKLLNEKFISNAPADVVAGIREAQTEHTEKLKHLQAALEMLG